MRIERELFRTVKDSLFLSGAQKKVLVVYGPRQVGKTTLMKQLLETYPQNAMYYNCDYPDVQTIFSYEHVGGLKPIVGHVRLLILDEAQRIKNIGLVLKILVDEFPSLQVVATGSSSFDLSNEINEPLTGRKIELQLLPFSLRELYDHDPIERSRALPDLLRYGSYPVVVLESGVEKENGLKELVGSYLFKDVFQFQELRKPEILTQLLRLLAFQIGSEVSYQELARALGVEQGLVQRYIYLLEQAFVVFRLPAFSRNLRKEVVKSRKIYFYDLGVRNTLIQNYNPLDLRNDVGALWENFCIAERYKRLVYNRELVNRFFWRTYDQKEIDYLEESGGSIRAYEFTWNSDKKKKKPVEFLDTYPGSTFSIISQDTYSQFLLGE